MPYITRSGNTLEDEKRVFPSRLRTLINESGLDRAELAEKLGVHINTIDNWTTGRRDPRAVDLVTLAELFRVSVDWLIREDVTTRSADTSTVTACKVTGLSEEAIRRLIMMDQAEMTVDGTPNTSRALSALLTAVIPIGILGDRHPAAWLNSFTALLRDRTQILDAEAAIRKKDREAREHPERAETLKAEIKELEHFCHETRDQAVRWELDVWKSYPKMADSPELQIEYLRLSGREDLAETLQPKPRRKEK